MNTVLVGVLVAAGALLIIGLGILYLFSTLFRKVPQGQALVISTTPVRRRP